MEEVAALVVGVDADVLISLDDWFDVVERVCMEVGRSFFLRFRSSIPDMFVTVLHSLLHKKVNTKQESRWHSCAPIFGSPFLDRIEKSRIPSFMTFFSALKNALSRKRNITEIR